MVGLFLLKLLQLFQHRFLLRHLTARCRKLLLIQHHVDILADIFQCGDAGCKVSSWVCSSALLDCSAENRHPMPKNPRCAAVQLHQGADSFIKGVKFLLVLGGISVLGQLEVLLDKGVMDGLQLGMDGGSVLDLGRLPAYGFRSASTACGEGRQSGSG